MTIDRVRGTTPGLAVDVLDGGREAVRPGELSSVGVSTAHESHLVGES